MVQETYKLLPLLEDDLFEDGEYGDFWNLLGDDLPEDDCFLLFEES